MTNLILLLSFSAFLFFQGCTPADMQSNNATLSNYVNNDIQQNVEKNSLVNVAF